MGRSVSYARGSIAKVYYDVSNYGYSQGEDGEEAEQGASERPTYDEWLGQMHWEDFKEWLRHDIETLWPSFKPCEEWLGREDLAFMENRFAYIGLSEYCGCACLWLVPKALARRRLASAKESEGYYPEDRSVGTTDFKLDNLAKGWTNRIAPKFSAKFGEFVRIGGFSNGESIYERKVK